MDRTEIENRFPQTSEPDELPENKQAHDAIRNMTLRYALDINTIVPDGDRKDAALYHLDLMMKAAHAGIAKSD
jgi:hypothetical protein